MFSLHPQLERDTFSIGDLPLSRVLLVNNCEFPWVILVPRRPKTREWHNLERHDQLQLHKESMTIGEMLMNLFNGDKLNTAAIGNMVPQLHLHHIVRFKDDQNWPGTVWGNTQNTPYTKVERIATITKLQQGIFDSSIGFSAC